MATPRTAPIPSPAKISSIGKLNGEGPVWLQIRRVLSQPILSGKWPPGTKLPSEIDLTGHFGASRMTVNKAIQSLVSEGLVRRRPKTGTVVASRAQERPVFEIWDIADLIANMGSRYSYKLLGSHKLGDEPEQRALLGVASTTPVLWMLCLHLSDGKPFELEERMVNVEAAPDITRQPLERVSPGAWLLAHVPWSDAEHRIMAQPAPREVAKHLEVKPGTACLVVDRRTWNQAGDETVPVTYARLWHAGPEHSLVGRFEPRR